MKKEKHARNEKRGEKKNKIKEKYHINKNKLRKLRY
jgi:hypothetical protein